MHCELCGMPPLSDISTIYCRRALKNVCMSSSNNLITWTWPAETFTCPHDVKDLAVVIVNEGVVAYCPPDITLITHLDVFPEPVERCNYRIAKTNKIPFVIIIEFTDIIHFDTDEFNFFKYNLFTNDGRTLTIFRGKADKDFIRDKSKPYAFTLYNRRNIYVVDNLGNQINYKKPKLIGMGWNEPIFEEGEFNFIVKDDMYVVVFSKKK